MAFRQDFATIYPARDKSKDQAYFLALVPESSLKAVFPLFDRNKAELRAEAAQMGLPLPEPKESQEICFLCRMTTTGLFEKQGSEASGSRGGFALPMAGK